MKSRDKIGDNLLLHNISSPKLGCKKLNLKKDTSDNSKLTNGNSVIMHTKPLAKYVQRNVFCSVFKNFFNL